MTLNQYDNLAASKVHIHTHTHTHLYTHSEMQVLVRLFSLKILRTVDAKIQIDKDTHIGGEHCTLYT